MCLAWEADLLDPNTTHGATPTKQRLQKIHNRTLLGNMFWAKHLKVYFLIKGVVREATKNKQSKFTWHADFLQQLVDISKNVFWSHPRFAATFAFQLGLHQSPSLPKLAQQCVQASSSLPRILQRQPQRAQEVL